MQFKSCGRDDLSRFFGQRFPAPGFVPSRTVLQRAGARSPQIAQRPGPLQKRELLVEMSAKAAGVKYLRLEWGGSWL
jgi:hypothetical protein